MVKGKSQFHDCPKCGAGGIIPDENGRCTHCGAVITEPTIRQDRPSPMPQSEPSLKPSRSCSIPGVIAGLLVIGVGIGNLLIHKRDGMELAMNLCSSGAWLFAGAAIIVRSFLGPFSLLKLFMVFFGAFVLWLNVPFVLRDFRVAQAAVVKSEAYGSLAGRLFVVGLGVLFLWIGFKRSRKADPIEKTESEIPLSHNREEKSDIHPLDGKDHNSHQRMKDNYIKLFAVFIALVALGIFLFLKTGFIIPNRLAAKELLIDKEEIPVISDTESFLKSLKIESLEPCGSLESMNLAKRQAAIWSKNYKLIEVFSVSFLVQDGKAKSLVWCFVFRREEPEILIVLGSANKILKVGKQTKTAKFITDEKQEVQDWSYNPTEFNWHLRSIPINGKNRTVWFQKHWGRQPDDRTLLPWCDILDSGTGDVIEESYRSADTVGELFAMPIGSKHEQVLTILKSDRTQAGTMKLIMMALDLRDRLEVFYLAHGEGASLFDENNSEYSKGVILTHHLRENGYLASVYYENGERGIITDYLNMLLEADPNLINNTTSEIPNEVDSSTTNIGKTITNSIGMKLVYIEPGTFQMGSGDGNPDELPIHEVHISKGFYMGVTEVTQGQWVRVMGAEPSSDSSLVSVGENYPKVFVSWNDAVEFCKKLSALESGRLYQLPTEAQWEYACRAGTRTEYSFGDDEKDLGKYAWYRDNSASFGGLYASEEVGHKMANPWGLYDMHGNVNEFCRDCYDKDYYGKSPTTDPERKSSGSLLAPRVVRGGYSGDDPNECRSASREEYMFGRVNTIGFRVTMETVKDADSLPQNGAIHNYSNKERIAPLSIKTGGDKVHYFVKLTDWNTDTLVQTIFIRAGHTAETNVPLGSYRLKYAAGETWQGEDKLFGDKTIFSKAEKRFDFTQDGNNVSGYSVELILQTGGNLSTVHIPKSEW